MLGSRTASDDIKSDPKLVVVGLVALVLVLVLMLVVGGLPDEKTDIYLWPKTWI